MLTPLLTFVLLGALLPAPVQAPAHAKPAAPHSAPKPKSRLSSRSRSHSKAHTSTRRATPKRAEGITDARALQIQQALVQAGYLDQASGHWDAATQAAMTKYQKDRNWQTRYVPDARALIALGLGPAGDSVPAMTASAHAPGGHAN